MVRFLSSPARPAQVALLAAAHLAGCGAAPAPSPPSPPSAPGLRFADGDLALGAERFFTPGLAAWASDAGLPTTAAEADLRAALEISLDAPPALDCVAREYAARFHVVGRDLDPGALQALADHCGLWARPRRVIAVRGASLPAVTEALGRVASDLLLVPIGVGVAQASDGGLTAAVALPPGELILDPVPRRSDGPTLRLAGRAPDADALEILVAARGATARVPVTRGAGGVFSGQVPVERGVPTRVELVAPLRHFSRTLAVISVNDHPAAVPPVHPGGPLPPLATAQAEALARVNALRTAGGRPPLLAAAVLTSPLRSWMDQVAAGATDDPPVGLTDERGWPFARVLYGFTEGVDGAQAIDLLAATPSGAALLDSDEAAAVAVAARPFATATGFDLLVAALTPLRPLRGEEARAAVLAGLNAARGASPPLSLDPTLSALAEEAAQRALDGRLPWAALGEAVAERVRGASSVSGPFTVGGLSTERLESIDWTPEPIALEPRWRRAGVGVAAGPLPGGGPPRHVVLYILTGPADRSVSD